MQNELLAVDALATDLSDEAQTAQKLIEARILEILILQCDAIPTAHLAAKVSAANGEKLNENSFAYTLNKLKQARRIINTKSGYWKLADAD